MGTEHLFVPGFLDESGRPGLVFEADDEIVAAVQRLSAVLPRDTSNVGTHALEEDNVVGGGDPSDVALQPVQQRGGADDVPGGVEFEDQDIHHRS